MITLDFYLFYLVLEPLKKQKAPKVLADALLYIQKSLLEFGVTGVSIRELIDFVKICLQNNNQTVRNNGVSLLGTIRIFAGPGNFLFIFLCVHFLKGIRSFVADLNSSLLATIDTEFEAVTSKVAPEPLKESKMLSSKKSAAAAKSKKAAPGKVFFSAY